MFVLPGIITQVPSNFVADLWTSCSKCGSLLLKSAFEKNQMVCSRCNHHHKISAKDRLKLIFDYGRYDEFLDLKTHDDPINFEDLKKYKDRLHEAREKTSMNDAFIAGYGTLENCSCVIGAMEFDFIGGSLGLYVGEAIIQSVSLAKKKNCPLILFTASGGARMQEGIISLMQMPRTCVALNDLKDMHIPYIVVLTNPTTGGVSASFAMLGDVTLAEPCATIGFAGTRVIQNIMGSEKLPDNFQTSEFQLQHGFVDKIVERKHMKSEIANLLKIFSAKTFEL